MTDTYVGKHSADHHLVGRRVVATLDCGVEIHGTVTACSYVAEPYGDHELTVSVEWDSDTTSVLWDAEPAAVTA